MLLEAERAAQVYRAHCLLSRPKRAAVRRRFLYSSLTALLAMMLYRTLQNDIKPLEAAKQWLGAAPAGLLASHVTADQGDRTQADGRRANEHKKLDDDLHGQDVAFLL